MVGFPSLAMEGLYVIDRMYSRGGSITDDHSLSMVRERFAPVARLVKSC